MVKNKESFLKKRKLVQDLLQLHNKKLYIIFIAFKTHGFYYVICLIQSLRKKSYVKIFNKSNYLMRSIANYY